MEYKPNQANWSQMTLKKSILISNRLIVIMLATVVGYCVKCKAKRDMENPKQITMKNGRLATEGTCGTCGTRMFKIGGGSISAGSSGSKAVVKKPVKSKAVAEEASKIQGCS